MNKMKQHQESL